MRIAQQYGVVYVSRQCFPSLMRLLSAHEESEVLVLGKDTWRLVHKGGSSLSFHPGSSRLRVRQLRKGLSDPFFRYLRMRPGDALLDATMGLGADATVASYITQWGGSSGRVEGWESQLSIFLLAKHGLQTYVSPDRALMQAMRNVVIHWRDHRRDLRRLPERCFDIVYLDPMFLHPGSRSPSIQALRSFANCSPLEKEMVGMAQRVARRAVILKADASFPFYDFGFSLVKKAGYHFYGVLPTEECVGV